MRDGKKEAERQVDGRRWRYVIGRYLKTLAWRMVKDVKGGKERVGTYDVIFTMRL